MVEVYDYLFGLLCVTQLSLHECQNTRPGPCSYFGGGRTPKEAYSLSNCTWYKENACCERTEVTSVFSEMPALATSDKGCYHRMNYLMCYFCSPKQHLWFNYSVSVCRSYCDELYKHCGSAKYDGMNINSKYENGKAFCEAQMFNVVDKMDGTENCFEFDPSPFDTSQKTAASSWFILSVMNCFTIYWLSPTG